MLSLTACYDAKLTADCVCHQAPVRMMSSNGDPPDVIRYQVAIPVNELQVRQNVQDHSERQGMWELVHCRSEKEGRPERVYQYQRYPQFCSVRYKYDAELV